jgi:hypothetical protein
VVGFGSRAEPSRGGTRAERRTRRNEDGWKGSQGILNVGVFKREQRRRDGVTHGWRRTGDGFVDSSMGSLAGGVVGRARQLGDR